MLDNNLFINILNNLPVWLSQFLFNIGAEKLIKIIKSCNRFTLVIIALLMGCGCACRHELMESAQSIWLSITRALTNTRTDKIDEVNALVRAHIENQSTGGARMPKAETLCSVVCYVFSKQGDEFVKKDWESDARKYPLRDYVCESVASEYNEITGDWAGRVCYRCILQDVKGTWQGYDIKENYIVRLSPDNALHILQFEEIEKTPFSPSPEEVERVRALTATALPIGRSGKSLTEAIPRKSEVENLAREFVETQSSDGGDLGFKKLHYPVSYYGKLGTGRAFVERERLKYCKRYPVRRFICEDVNVSAGERPGEWIVSLQYRCELTSFRNDKRQILATGSCIVREFPGGVLKICAITERVLVNKLTRSGERKRSHKKEKKAGR